MAKHPPISDEIKINVEKHWNKFVSDADLDDLGGEKCCVRTEFSVLSAIVLGKQDPVEWILDLIEDYSETEIPDKKTEKVG
jgi:hypothetical protein